MHKCTNAQVMNQCCHTGAVCTWMGQQSLMSQGMALSGPGQGACVSLEPLVTWTWVSASLRTPTSCRYRFLRRELGWSSPVMACGIASPVAKLSRWPALRIRNKQVSITGQSSCLDKEWKSHGFPAVCKKHVRAIGSCTAEYCGAVQGVTSQCQRQMSVSLCKFEVLYMCVS